MIRREHRFEILVVSVIVLLAAFYVRAEYIPPWTDQVLDVAAEKWGLPVTEVGPWFSAWTQGDGQAYAEIASDPLGQHLDVELKEPGYRYQRAGYSWLAWIASAGQNSLIPYALALVGALAVVGTLVMAISLRDRLGPAAWFIVLNPALYIGFAGDTAEPLAILFLGSAMASSGVMAAVALGVTRPDYLLALIGRWKPFLAGVSAALTLIVYSVVIFGIEGSVPHGGRVGLPVAGYLAEPSLAGWTLAALATVTLVIGVRRRNWTWISVGVYVLCFGHFVLENPVNAWRAAGLMPVLWAFGPAVPRLQGRESLPTEAPAAV